jgi:hypothetical protein
MISTKIDRQKSFLKLITNEGSEEFSSNEIISFPHTNLTDTFQSAIVFAGYGFQNNETGYNDFEGLDLKDKTVMIMTRNRELSNHTIEESVLTNSEMAKLGRIFMLGAKAILFVADPLSTDNSWFEMVKEYASQGMYQINDSTNINIPGNIILANIEIANAILKETGKTLEEIQLEINESGKPNSFDLKQVTTKIQLTMQTDTVFGENVIAVVEGTDPLLKNECVILTAHYDHVGINGKGEINNGADDNGSGTVALLEIAEAFSTMKNKPPRSIVFAWVTAEEKGLIGSEYYTLNPLFPLEKTVANINLDMVGRSANHELEKVENPEKSLAGPNGVYIIIGEKSPELTDISNKICKKMGLIPSDALNNEFMNSSDQYNFYKNGIPVIGISTGLHEDYHQPTDDFYKIDYHKMKRICDYTFLITYQIAKTRKRFSNENPIKIKF